MTGGFAPRIRRILSVPYIHHLPKWPRFQWDHEQLLPILGRTRHQQGLMLGGMLSLGFRFRQQTSLANLAIEVLNALLDLGEEDISTSKYAKLARTSLDTALRDIRQLIDVGVLKSGTSGGRSKKYTLFKYQRETPANWK